MDKQPSPTNNSIAIEVVGKNEGFCRTGIPFPTGKVTSLTQLTLHLGNNTIECHAHPLCYWQDGSIKWINIGFFHSATAQKQYHLLISNEPTVKPTFHDAPGLQISNDANNLTISTPEHRFTISLTSLALTAQRANKPQLTIASLAGTLSSDNQPTSAKLTHWRSRSFQSLTSNNAVNIIELELEGYFEYKTDKQPLRFTTVVEFYRAMPLIKIQTTLHNPNPATHPRGLWDLGDQGSELLNAFGFDLELANNDNLSYQISRDAPWQQARPDTHITQHASGGDNWQSPIHVDKNNQVTLKTNGFEITENHNQISTGIRATPIIYGVNGTSLTVGKFWENFPSSIIINNKNKLQINLFPAINGTLHELQGGEKKTHTFWLNFSDQSDALHWVHTPPTAKADTDWLVTCSALPVFIPISETDGVAKLIGIGLTHEHNFFAKRETVDEYGWRNFGDLYADHESLGYKGKELFISHYNNQYDPIYGFLRQFLLTGDNRWFELADDLAQHVKDIDIYHTTDDKAEYNGGLFWHTDHYLKAATATHRSFSKAQGNTPDVDRSGGGGPGGQHCYTTGLAYHHLLTGSEESKQMVLSLTQWIARVYDGSNTCFELLLAFKNRQASGRKNHFNGQYPLDRGTGYYIIALLDCYQLTQEPDYLLKAEQIIRNTAHPADDIAERNLANIEECWFYTVLLQAICHFLDIKDASKSYDEAFYYARDTLLHYANWMLVNESPYLHKSEILEFPNDTWAAQELRKTHILAAAFYYAPNDQEPYLDKAKFFRDYVVTQLSTSIEKSYTRILVLLMQNHGPYEYYSSRPTNNDFRNCRQDWPKANYQQSCNIGFSLIKEFFKRLLKLSIKNEIRWIKMRIER
ncbi:MAG: hypothetical protein L3J89_07635 [Gammaproteobacteria bacterium]|nr:hypothetical protein [Gammaproteobacteria bacterium]